MSEAFPLSLPLDMNALQPSRLLRQFGLLLLASCALTATLPAKTSLKIAASTQLVDEFTKWTATTPWEKIDSFASPHAIRPVVDLVLQLQALKAGGLDFDFTFVPCPNYERAKLTVVQGGADLAAETLWNDDITENAPFVLNTEPIIRVGEFMKGVYVLPTNEKLLKITTLAELQAYTGAVVAAWALDAKTLVNMKPKGVEKPTSLDGVFLMLQKQRADFTLQEFSSAPDMSIEVAGVKLVPIPHCTVALAGSRAWVVAKSSPASADIIAALNKGTTSLRAAGTFEKAFTESGFFNPKIKDWQRLF